MKNKIIHGDAFAVMREIPKESVHAIITDPPYASGGLHMGARTAPSNVKYMQNNGKGTAAEYAKHNFFDCMDSRSYVTWSREWLQLAHKCTIDGGVVAVFCDWRQLPIITDVVQQSGWTWRGIMVWDKINARPQPMRPKAQCEYIVWGSKGALSVNRDAAYLPGMISCSAPAAPMRKHQTEKPIELMRKLVCICEKGGTILDPFAGSGTTCAAAKLEGFNYIGVECDDYYYKIAEEKLNSILPLVRG